MSPKSTIFTESTLGAARSNQRSPAPLVYRWALDEGERGSALRAQLERVATLVPEHQRQRVVGPLFSWDGDQAQGAANMLLLAGTMTDMGWSVEYEPVVPDGTPDLRVQKGAADFIIEVRRVIGDARLSNDREMARVQRALKKIRTTTPVFFDHISISHNASLGRFLAHLRRVLRERPAGCQTFRDEGVLLVFELLPEGAKEMGAFAGYVGDASCVDDFPAVETAVVEKLKRYKQPIIVALDMADCFDPFQTAEEVMCGREVISIPINVTTGGPAGEPRLARSADAIMRGRSRDAERARERLQALLPFEVGYTAKGFRVRAHVLANPYAPDSRLTEFEPFPVLTVTGSDERSFTMKYVRDGAALSREAADAWEHLP